MRALYSLLLFTCAATPPPAPTTPAPAPAPYLRPAGPAREGLNEAALAKEIEALAARAAPGTLGVAVRNLETTEYWALNGEEPFPMQSVFKAPLGAAVLAQVDAGKLSLSTPIEIKRAELSIFRSPIAAKFVGDAMTFTVQELLTAAVGDSDNTAADILMKKIGGPKAVNDHLAAHGIVGLRVDRYETELQTQMNGLSAFDPSMITYEGMQAALSKLTKKERQEAFAVYLKDPRDTSTPMASIFFLEQLVLGALLSPASTKVLLQIMEETGTGKNRLKAGLPSGVRLAHKTGTSLDVEGVNGATNDIGVITIPGGDRIAVSVFLRGATLSEEQREALIADVARAVLSATYYRTN